jgi:hypothetical protein
MHMKDLQHLPKKALIGEILTLRRKLSEHEALRASLALVRVCSHCRDCWSEEEQRWIRFESLFHRRVGAEFTHGICKRCYEAERRKHPTLPPLEEAEQRSGT